MRGKPNNPVIYSDNRAYNQSQLNSSKSISDLNKNAQNGNTLSGISLKVGNNQIAHKLNRPLTGWYIVRQKTPSTVVEYTDQRPQNNIFLYINSTADCVVDIYVF